MQQEIKKEHFSSFPERQSQKISTIYGLHHFWTYGRYFITMATVTSRRYPARATLSDRIFLGAVLPPGICLGIFYAWKSQAHCKLVVDTGKLAKSYRASTA